MKINQLKFLFVVLFASTSTFAQAVFAQSADTEESNFYNPTIGSARETLTDVSGKDDSDRLQALIEDVNRNGGGIVTIDSGKHYFRDVKLRSDVHIRVKSGATLIPVSPGSDKSNINMFIFGDKKNRVSNVSFEGTSNTSRPKIDFSNLNLDPGNQYTLGAQVIKLTNTENFRIANLDIKDKQSNLSSVGLNMLENNYGNKPPEDGVVKNISTYNAHVGYGTVQLHSATHVLFKNLYSDGGVALRLESGNVGENQLIPLITDQIYGRNIRGKDCFAAVLISPHELDQGRFDIRDVTGDGCGFAVKIAPGYPEGKRGTYQSNSILRDVKATFGRKAQTNWQGLKYLPCALQDDPVKVTNNPTYTVPSISAVGYISNYKIDFRDSDVTGANGFVEAKKVGTHKVVRDKDLDKLQCPS